jgi:Fe-S oxidoreductase
MCPTFLVTGREVLSTRGRANIIRWVLQRTANGSDPLKMPELEEVLDSCLSCKACVSECPSNVNLPLLKADLLNARITRHGPGLKEILISSIDLLGRAGCVLPTIANAVMETCLARQILSKFTGLSSIRPLPRFTRNRFDRWFARRPSGGGGARGRIILWDDTFVRYYEPHIGVAAVKVLEAAGFQVELAANRKCCGRPAFSQGYLKAAREMGCHNVNVLSEGQDDVPILFLEPSCYSMFIQDYFEMKVPAAERIASRCFLFEDFLDTLLEADPGALSFKPKAGHVVIHAHCHVKALTNPAFLMRLAARLPLKEAELLKSACCGMAGAFGMLAKNHELSLQVADPLIQMIRAQPFGTAVVASGASCRQQISELVPIRARHMAEVLAEALG